MSSIDILSILFEDLEHENDKTLYSCIFVNKEWCQVAIPFLWKNPWKNFSEDPNPEDQQINHYKILFKCFFTMMSKESKEFLKMNEINFLIEDNSSRSNSPLLQTPLFNYASFCKVIDSFKINDMVDFSFDYLITVSQQYLVGQEILKLLVSNTSKLKILMLHRKSHPIASFPNSSLSLSQLNELHCDSFIDAEIFYELSQLCRNIERLVIRGNNDLNHGLISLIKQQINLKRVKIWEDHNFRYFVQGQCKNLGEALATKTASIIELDLGKCVIMIPPILLKKFQNNLTVFKFGINNDLIDAELYNELENILSDISLPNLQQLIIYEYPFDIIAKIVAKTNGELKKIDVGSYLFSKYSDLLNSTIAKHCPKLEFAAVSINDPSEILELIKECKELRGLVVEYQGKHNIGELFKIIYNNASNQLRKLQLVTNWEITEKDLNDFFENWNQQQRNSLDFYIPSNIIYDEHEDIIKEYQELGVIRKFEKFIKYTGILDSWM